MSERVWNYDLREELRRCESLAPVVPPEVLARCVKEAPVVCEVVRLLSIWYLLLSQILYADVDEKLLPGILDRDLDRMESVLAELRGTEFRKLERYRRASQGG